MQQDEWEEIFFKEVKRAGNLGLEVWDPVRNDFATVAYLQGKLFIKPSIDEAYPISLSAARENRMEYIRRMYSPAN